MAGNTNGFKHISVTSAEEDEVIIAGERTVSGPPSEAVASSPGVDDSRLGIEEVESSSASDRGSSQEPPVSHPIAGDSNASNRSERAYRETTLEDLESGPLPLTQKIVIIAAVVCIIGALVYYFVAMR